MRSIEDLEKELKSIVSSKSTLKSEIRKIKEKKSPRHPKRKEKKKSVKQNVKVVKQNVKVVKQNVKVHVKKEDILECINQGLNQSQIAKKYNLSRSAISQRIKRLKEHGLLNKQTQIKNNVKVFSLPMKPNYELQTIQILIPLKKPNQFDLIKWDKVIPDIKQSYKKYPYFKFTLKRTSKSIVLFLHKRYIEYPKQVEEICKAYVKWCAEQFLQYDIELDIEKSRAYGLHLWKQDQVVEKEYNKEDGTIGVYHGQPSKKIFKYDKPKERKTWVDSTPTPDGIESNDYSYFMDKKTLEEYMKAPTLFVNVLNKYDKNVSVLNDNIIGKFTPTINKLTEQIVLHLDVQKKTQQLLDNQINLMNQELKVRSIERSGLKSKEKSSLMKCPLCKAEFSSKLLVNSYYLCPSCKRDLRLYFPSLEKKK